MLKGFGAGKQQESRVYVRDTIAGRVLIVLPRRLNHTMDGAPDGIVTPTGQQVAGIDHNGAFNGRRIDKVPRGRFDLQTALAVLEK